MSIFSIFKRGFQKTATAISRTVFGLFSSDKPWGPEEYAKIEKALLEADFGIHSTRRLLADLKDRYSRGLIKTQADIEAMMSADLIARIGCEPTPLVLENGKLNIVVMVGVNGAGKTTTAGKMAHRFHADGKKVMLAACDTFRAAAVEQLNLWAERTASPIVTAKAGADPAAVAFDAVTSARARNCDVLIIDTAGRQHTRKALMDELAKVMRVIQKQAQDAVVHVLLTLDASIGANAIAQAEAFSGTAGVTGLVLTKLDGTGRGGVIVAIYDQLKLPIYWVGLGEQLDDLQVFNPELYVQALFSENGQYAAGA